MKTQPKVPIKAPVKAPTKTTPTKTKKPLPEYKAVYQHISDLLSASRSLAARSVNAVMTATYWEIGRRIVLLEQGGKARSDYAEYIIPQLSKDLTQKFGRGFSRANLFQFKSFYLAYPHIVQTVSGQFEKSQTASDKFELTPVANRFPLSWSHYVRLLSVKSEPARAFYETESLRGGWSVRQLDRQISTLFYERTALSKNKSAVLKKGATPQAGETPSPESEIKDPFVLEFLNLKDEYGESDLEEALINHLEDFLMELGGDFAFIGRQKKLRIGDEWYKVDLIFFHRTLRSLVIVDLKLGKFSHTDVGQMHLYLNYAQKHWMNAGENPPVGLILCAEKNTALASYTLDTLPNKVMAAEYKLKLPDAKVLAEEIRKTQLALNAKHP